jgi:hypothetical protein
MPVLNKASLNKLITRSFYFFLLIFLLGACGQQSSFQKQIQGADSLVINFNTPLSDTISRTITTTEKTAIKKLSNYIDSKSSPAFKCRYDGNIIFYKEGTVAADVAFNYSIDSCRHFIQMISEKPSSTSLSNEAADFLRSLAEGKNWY